VTAALVLGTLFGLGVVTAWRLAWPPPTPLPVALARLAGCAEPADAGLRPVGVEARLGRWLGPAAAAAGIDLTGFSADLRLVGRTAEQHLGAKGLLGLVGALLPPAWAGLVALAGVNVSLAGVFGAALVLAGVGFVLPDLLLKSQAADRRRDFLAALGSFLDLVVIALAGGSGVESALRDASRVGRGWAFVELQGAIEAARLSGQSPWAACSRLGDELGVPALVELAASVSLAGTEGARVRESLAAKAAAIRARQLADAEAEAQAATERLAIPTVLLLTGFVILIGYPALDAVLSGL
jgi:tight adherence protein C